MASLFLLVALRVISPIWSIPELQLRTTIGQNLAHGLAFDVKANADIEVTSLASLLQRRRRIDHIFQVWTKAGSYVDADVSWNLIFNETIPWTSIRGTRRTTLTPVNTFTVDPPVFVSGGNTQAFYITTANTEVGSTVVTGQGKVEGTLVVRDNNLDVFEGSTFSSYFEADSESSGFLCGFVNYQLSGASEVKPNLTNNKLEALTRTTDTGEMRVQSIMFDVEAQQNLTITELLVPVERMGRSTQHLVQVWTKRGGFSGATFDQWQPVSAQSIYLRGFTVSFRNFVSLPISPVDIVSGETQAFYVTVLGDGENQHFLASPGRAENSINVDLGGIVVFDANVQINEGIALTSFFDEGSGIPIAWNGILKYNLRDGDDNGTTESSCPYQHIQYVASGLEEQSRLVTFDLEFEMDATLESLVLLFSTLYEGANYIVSVWTAPGSLATSDQDLSTWEVVFRSSVEVDFTVVLSKQNFRSVQFKAGQRRAFAVGVLFVDDDAEDFPLYVSNGLGEIAVKTPNLSLFEDGEVFNGVLRYSSCAPLDMYMSQCHGPLSRLRTLPLPFDPRRTFGVTGPQGGIMFDVSTTQRVEVSGLDTVFADGDNLFSSSGIVSVWTKTGSYKGFENDQDAWTLVYRHHLVWERDGNAVDPLDRSVFAPVVIEEQKTQAFYVTQHADSPHGTVNVLPPVGASGVPVEDDGVVTVYSGIILPDQFGVVVSDIGYRFAGFVEYRLCSSSVKPGIAGLTGLSKHSNESGSLDTMLARMGALAPQENPNVTMMNPPTQAETSLSSASTITAIAPFLSVFVSLVFV